MQLLLCSLADAANGDIVLVVVQAYQLFKARAFGADAVLLIAAVLPNNDLEYLVASARKVKLQCLIEVREHLMAICTQVVDCGLSQMSALFNVSAAWPSCVVTPLLRFGNRMLCL